MRYPPSTTLKTNIATINSSTGLPVYITEYDINLADDNQQMLADEHRHHAEQRKHAARDDLADELP